MKKIAAVTILGVSLAGCYQHPYYGAGAPDQKVVHYALAGGAAGGLIGGLATGNLGGFVVGAGIGAVAGAAIATVHGQPNY
jgi:predicted lipid-binding transport protein (Tim44 family)